MQGFLKKNTPSRYGFPVFGDTACKNYSIKPINCSFVCAEYILILSSEFEINDFATS